MFHTYSSLPLKGKFVLRVLLTNKFWSKIVKHNYWQDLHEYIAKLPNSFSLHEFDSSFDYLFMKINGIHSIMFALGHLLRWYSLCQKQCSSIVIMNWYMHDSQILWKAYCITKRVNHVKEWSQQLLLPPWFREQFHFDALTAKVKDNQPQGFCS